MPVSVAPAARTSGTVRRVMSSSLASTPVTGAAAPSAAARPASVRLPVATTTASARPAAIAVPAYAIDVRSATAVSDATASTCFATGSDSPVRADSSVSTPRATTIRLSAGTMSPACNSTTSPSTSSAAAIESSLPPRRIRTAWLDTDAVNLRMACSVCSRCAAPMHAFTPSTPVINRPSAERAGNGREHTPRAEQHRQRVRELLDEQRPERRMPIARHIHPACVRFTNVESRSRRSFRAGRRLRRRAARAT